MRPGNLKCKKKTGQGLVMPMAILYHEEKHIFTLQTTRTTYQMKVDEFGFLLHLYYGGKITGQMDYLLTYQDRGFSGNPFDTGNDRTYSMDVLPQEYPCLGSGDYRSSALVIRNGDGSEKIHQQS